MKEEFIYEHFDLFEIEEEITLESIQKMIR